MIPGLDYVELRDADRCCGSAGIYNILQPDMSMRVLDDKTEAILESGAETIVTANPGCLIQINAGLRQAGQTASAQHIVDLLDEAIRAGQREQARSPVSACPQASDNRYRLLWPVARSSPFLNSVAR